jgi:hypothetical protein
MDVYIYIYVYIFLCSWCFMQCIAPTITFIIYHFWQILLKRCIYNGTQSVSVLLNFL